MAGEVDDWILSEENEARLREITTGIVKQATIDNVTAFYKFLKPIRPLQLSVIAELNVITVLVSIVSAKQDVELVKAALRVLMIWPVAMTDMTEVLLDVGFAAIISGFLLTTGNVFQLFSHEIFTFLGNLVVYFVPCRNIFFDYFSIMALYNGAMSGMNNNNSVAIASCLAAVAKYVLLDEESAGHLMRVFAIVLALRISPGNAKNEAQQHALAGILVITETDTIRIDARRIMLECAAIHALLPTFLSESCMSRECPLAVRLLAHMFALNVQSGLSPDDVMNLLQRLKAHDRYHVLVATEYMITMMPDEMFAQQRLEVMWTGFVGIACSDTYDCKVMSMWCLIAIVRKSRLEEVWPKLSDGFFRFLLGLARDADDDRLSAKILDFVCETLRRALEHEFPVVVESIRMTHADFHDDFAAVDSCKLVANTEAIVAMLSK